MSWARVESVCGGWLEWALVEGDKRGANLGAVLERIHDGLAESHGCVAEGCVSEREAWDGGQ